VKRANETAAAPCARTPGIGARPGYYLLVLLCLSGLFVCIPLELAMPSLVLTALGVGALGLVDLRALMVLAFPGYALLGALYSVVLIERGAYVSEQFRYGFNIGAAPALGAYALGFLLAAHVGVSAVLSRMRMGDRPVSAKRFKAVIVFSAVAVTFFYAATFVLVGTGLQYASRFGWVQELPVGLARLHGVSRSFLIPATAALWGFYLGYFRRIESWQVVLIGPVACIALTGEKLSAFLAIGSFVLLGIALASYLAGRQVAARPRAVLGVLLAACLMAVSLIQGFRRMGAVDLATAVENRVVLQGHVWFGIADRFEGHAGVPWTVLVRRNSAERPAGLDHLSYLVSDSQFVHSRIVNGITFTMGGPPGVLAGAGFLVGFIVFSLLGLLYALAAWSALRALRDDAPLWAAATLSFFSILSATLLMGQWDAIYGPVGLACLLAVVARWLVPPRSGGSVRSTRPDNRRTDA